jgi:hypothetical protein
MLVYRTEVNSFVPGAATGRLVFGEISAACLYFHMALLARLSFNYGPVEQPSLPTNQRLARKQVAKIWFRTGKSIVQGTSQAHKSDDEDLAVIAVNGNQPEDASEHPAEAAAA